MSIKLPCINCLTLAICRTEYYKFIIDVPTQRYPMNVRQAIQDKCSIIKGYMHNDKGWLKLKEIMEFHEYMQLPYARASNQFKPIQRNQYR